MTSPTQRTNAEEARKELLATIHASRELGPEMDDTLADRFIEKLATLRPANSFDKTSTRAKLELLLQSARGSDPQADGALADSFLEGIQPPRVDVQPYAYGGAPAPYPYGPTTPYSNQAVNLAPMIICAVVFIAALAFTGGHLWWLIFFLPGVFGLSRRGRYQQQRRLQREQWRAQRNDRILNRDEINNPRLPPQRPPEII